MLTIWALRLICPPCVGRPPQGGRGGCEPARRGPASNPSRVVLHRQVLHRRLPLSCCADVLPRRAAPKGPRTAAGRRVRTGDAPAHHAAARGSRLRTCARTRRAERARPARRPGSNASSGRRGATRRRGAPHLCLHPLYGRSGDAPPPGRVVSLQCAAACRGMPPAHGSPAPLCPRAPAALTGRPLSTCPHPRSETTAVLLLGARPLGRDPRLSPVGQPAKGTLFGRVALPIYPTS